MAYIVEADIEESLGAAFTIPSPYADTEQLITDAIKRASDAIDIATRSHFESQSRTLILDGDGTRTLDVWRATTWPIISITSITYREDPEDDWDSANILTADTEYVLNRKTRRSVIRITNKTDRSVIRSSVGGRENAWLMGVQNYRLIAAFGYSNVPEGIRKAAVLLVREEMDPGYIEGFEQLQSERFADGYGYTRATKSAGPSAGGSTGHPVVDNLLRSFSWRPPASILWL